MNSSVAKTTRFFRLLFCVAALVFIFAPPSASARPRLHANLHNITSNPRYSMIIMDAQSGRILRQQNAHSPLPPASLTKMMTLFLTFEAIEHHRISMEQNLLVSQNAARQAPSRLGLHPGDDITVREGIQVLVTRSANDVAMALAETIGGSEQRFAQMMTQRAHSLGMKDSGFYNPSGLPHPQQKSSAYDMAILARALMQYFPQHYHYFGIIHYNFRGQIIETHNNLMRRFPGMDGLKTGYTAASGFNLVASAVRNNRRIIVAVFGGRSAAARDNHVAELMDQGLAELENSKAVMQVATAKPLIATPIPPATPVQAATENATPPAVQAVQVQTSVPAADDAALTASSGDRAGWRPDGGQVQPLQTPAQRPVAAVTTTSSNGAGLKNWGIQIGAFSNTALSQQILQSAQLRLKSIVAEEGQPVIIPATTPQGVIYRARIIGLSAADASKACEVLSECMAFTVH